MTPKTALRSSATIVILVFSFSCERFTREPTSPWPEMHMDGHQAMQVVTTTLNQHGPSVESTDLDGLAVRTEWAEISTPELLKHGQLRLSPNRYVSGRYRYRVRLVPGEAAAQLRVEVDLEGCYRRKATAADPVERTECEDERSKGSLEQILTQKLVP